MDEVQDDRLKIEVIDYFENCENDENNKDAKENGENQTSKNTQRKTETDMKTFQKWLVGYGEMRKIEEIPLHELDQILGEFYTTITKSDGSDYEPQSIKSLQCSISRYLVNTASINIVQDGEFSGSRALLAERILKLKCKGLGSIRRKAEPFTKSEIEALYNHGQLGTGNPRALIHSVWLMNTVYFGLGSRKDHLASKWGDIILATTPDGVEFLQYTKISKRLMKLPDQLKVYAEPGNPRCPVFTYKEYRRRRPDAMNTPESPFYLRIAKDFNDGKWYSPNPAGKNTLASFVKSMCEEAGVEGRKTNNSAKKSSFVFLGSDNTQSSDNSNFSYDQHSEQGVNSIDEDWESLKKQVLKFKETYPASHVMCVSIVNDDIDYEGCDVMKREFEQSSLSKEKYKDLIIGRGNKISQNYDFSSLKVKEEPEDHADTWNNSSFGMEGQNPGQVFEGQRSTCSSKEAPNQESQNSVQPSLEVQNQGTGRKSTYSSVEISRSSGTPNHQGIGKENQAGVTSSCSNAKNDEENQMIDVHKIKVEIDEDEEYRKSNFGGSVESVSGEATQRVMADEKKSTDDKIYEDSGLVLSVEAVKQEVSEQIEANNKIIYASQNMPDEAILPPCAPHLSNKLQIFDTDQGKFVNGPDLEGPPKGSQSKEEDFPQPKNSDKVQGKLRSRKNFKPKRRSPKDDGNLSKLLLSGSKVNKLGMLPSLEMSEPSNDIEPENPFMLTVVTKTSNGNKIVEVTDGSSISEEQKNIPPSTRTLNPGLKSGISLLNNPDLKSGVSLLNKPEIRSGISLLNKPEIRSGISLLNKPEIRSGISLLNKPEIKQGISLLNNQATKISQPEQDGPNLNKKRSLPDQGIETSIAKKSRASSSAGSKNDEHSQNAPVSIVIDEDDNDRYMEQMIRNHNKDSQEPGEIVEKVPKPRKRLTNASKPRNNPPKFKKKILTVDDKTCKICKEIFPRKSKLIKHMKENDECRTKLNTCETCGLVCSNGFTLQLHKETKHSDVKIHTCRVCNESFYQLESLQEHKLNHKKDDAESFPCKICNKVFNLKHYLNQHLLRRHGEKRHKCEMCGKLFSHNFQLWKHKRLVHLGIKPFECSFCDKTFTENHKMVQHEKCHTAELKPYKCDNCGESFRTFDQRKIHLIQEHKEKEKEVCRICNEEFFIRRQLRKHMTQKHATYVRKDPNASD